MKVISPDLVKSKKILLRYDIDVPIVAGKVTEDFRLKAGLDTLRLCLENGEQVILMGHIGRPNGREVKDLTVAPIYSWFQENGFREQLKTQKLRLLENLRFESGEEECDTGYSRELASLGEVYINEAFASYNKASSTTVLPTLLPHAAGLRFAKEVEKLTAVKNNPQKPLVVVMGGAKVQDKLPVVQVMSKIADSVLVGGKLIFEINELGTKIPDNAVLGTLTEDKLDITSQTITEWSEKIKQARTIVWNGPVGKTDGDNRQIEGTKALAHMILDSDAEIVIGGGDTISFLDSIQLLDDFEKKAFVSVGGGAMLKLFVEGSLPTIEVLK